MDSENGTSGQYWACHRVLYAHGKRLALCSPQPTPMEVPHLSYMALSSPSSARGSSAHPWPKWHQCKKRKLRWEGGWKGTKRETAPPSPAHSITGQPSMRLSNGEHLSAGCRAGSHCADGKQQLPLLRTSSQRWSRPLQSTTIPHTSQNDGMQPS